MIMSSKKLMIVMAAMTDDDDDDNDNEDDDDDKDEDEDKDEDDDGIDTDKRSSQWAEQCRWWRQLSLLTRFPLNHESGW